MFYAYRSRDTLCQRLYLRDLDDRLLAFDLALLCDLVFVRRVGGLKDVQLYSRLGLFRRLTGTGF